MPSQRPHITLSSLLSFFTLSLSFLSSVQADTDLVSGINSLNASVSGRLHQGVPLERACFKNVSSGVGGSYDPSACQVIQNRYTDQFFRVSQFGALMAIDYAGCQSKSQQCILDPLAPSDPLAFAPSQQCSQGSIAAYYIDVRKASDAIAAFNFAKAFGMPVSIKNTGHDFLGRSVVPGSLALWTHNLNSISLNNAFVAQGCSPYKSQKAVTMGAGVIFGDAYNFAEANDITIPGGDIQTVGAVGGYLQGGGHSLASPAFGLAVDRVIEFEIVTPTGSHLFANECQNSDLFFALRGGGGGTFGVVLSATLKALPKLRIPSFNATFDTSTDDLKRKFLNFYVTQAASYSNAGFGGYITILDTTFVTLVNANPNFPVAKSQALVEPLRQFVLNELKGTWANSTEPSWLSMWNNYVFPQIPPIGNEISFVSRLVPATVFANKTQAALVDATMDIVKNGVFNIICTTTPFLFSQNTNTTGTTSMTPAWRNSLWHIFGVTAWSWNTTLSDKQGLLSLATQSTQKMINLAPNSGVYQNECDIHGTNYQQENWGPNAAQLLKIKQKYDPDHMLDCWRCVGWQQSSSRFSCYI